MSDPTPPRPIPGPSPLTRPFWDSIAEHQLSVQQCDDCGVLRHYPRPLCPQCGGGASSWTPISGRGTIHTFTVAYHAFHPAWRGKTPYAVATIDLDEGVRMVAEIETDDVDEVAIGRAVEVVFRYLDQEDITIPAFRLRPPE